jgi:hypothetical protein
MEARRRWLWGGNAAIDGFKLIAMLPGDAAAEFPNGL